MLRVAAALCLSLVTGCVDDVCSPSHTEAATTASATGTIEVTAESTTSTPFTASGDALDLTSPLGGTCTGTLHISAHIAFDASSYTPTTVVEDNCYR